MVDGVALQMDVPINFLAITHGVISTEVSLIEQIAVSCQVLYERAAIGDSIGL